MIVGGVLGYDIANGIGAVVGVFLGALAVFYYAILAYSALLDEGDAPDEMTNP